jgi:hypothetical protein
LNWRLAAAVLFSVLIWLALAAGAAFLLSRRG